LESEISEELDQIQGPEAYLLASFAADKCTKIPKELEIIVKHVVKHSKAKLLSEMKDSSHGIDKEAAKCYVTTKRQQVVMEKLQDISLENLDEFANLQRQDKKIGKLIEEIEKQDYHKSLYERKDREIKKGEITFKITDRLLLGKVRDGNFRYVLPSELHNVVISQRHGLHHGGHVATLHAIASTFLWDKIHTNTLNLSMAESVKEVVDRCLSCQFFSSKKRPQFSAVFPLRHLSRGLSCGRSWALDLFSPGNNNKSPWKWAIGGICLNCRYAKVRCIRNASSSNIAQFIIENLADLEFPTMLLTDNAANLAGGEVAQLAKAFNAGLTGLKNDGDLTEDHPGYTHKFSSPFYPAGHSIIERLWSSLGQSLRRSMAHDVHLWHEHLPRICLLHNLIGHRSLANRSPASIHYAIDQNKLYPDYFSVLERANKDSDSTPFVLGQLSQNKHAERILRQAQDGYYSQQDKQWVRDHPSLLNLEENHGYSVGDLVLVRKFGLKDKLEKNGYFHGPGTILGFISPSQVRVQYLVTGDIVKRHFSHLKRFLPAISSNAEENRKFFNAPGRKSHGLLEEKVLILDSVDSQDLLDRELPLSSYQTSDTDHVTQNMMTGQSPDLTPSQNAMEEQHVENQAKLDDLNDQLEALGKGTRDDIEEQQEEEKSVVDFSLDDSQQDEVTKATKDTTIDAATKGATAESQAANHVETAARLSGEESAEIDSTQPESEDSIVPTHSTVARNTEHVDVGRPLSPDITVIPGDNDPSRAPSPEVRRSSRHAGTRPDYARMDRGY